MAAAFCLARLDGTIRYFRREAEINWIAAHQPDVWRRTHKFLLLSGYLNYRLCGQFIDSTGSMGLMLQPYWSPGIKVPGPEAKGAMIGFGDVHTRAHMYRAILEGLAYALREGKERIEKKSGVPITALRVAGGGSQSDAAMQLTADIFGMPAARAHT
ncbi:FGGY-family carbohydrate kinase [Janthinobacterium sp. RB2R34]|uniref:FGGY-family carbohydrate kinase n=1 Tax=Janthinobacterium sp. RB2R34 TaxID=3424193 RepID=UPI003F26690D